MQIAVCSLEKIFLVSEMKMNSGATIAKPKAITKEIHSTTFNVLVDISFLENNFSTTELLLLLKHNINFHLLLQTEVSFARCYTSEMYTIASTVNVINLISTMQMFYAYQ